MRGSPLFCSYKWKIFLIKSTMNIVIWKNYFQKKSLGRGLALYKRVTESSWAVGRALSKFKVGKYLQVEIKNHNFTFERDADKITQDQQRDGIYVIRTSLSSEDKDSFECVRTYKSLAKVESAFSYSQKRTESSAYLSLETRAGDRAFRWLSHSFFIFVWVSSGHSVLMVL